MVDTEVLTDLFALIVPFATCLGFGFASSLLYNVGEKGFGFSKNIFFLASSISIFVMIWVEALPIYFSVIAILFTVLILVGEIGGDEYE